MPVEPESRFLLVRWRHFGRHRLSGLDRAFRAFADNSGAISGGVRAASTKRGQIMTAFNAVRFKVKAGREQQFLDAHNKVAFAWPGLKQVNIIKTSEHTFCVIAEWTDMNAIVNAR